MLHRLYLLICLCVLSANTFAQVLPDGYDVVLLVGQSNMVGWGSGPDNARDAAVDPRVFQWDANKAAITPAVDALVQNPTFGGYVGLGLTFGKAYAASLPANRKVLLVGSASGGTSFVSGRWQAPNGDLAATALARANAAMAAAGPGARFAGVLWHQGESDIVDGGAPTYRANLLGLINFFRSSITGAGSTTPFVAGELVYPWMASITGDPSRLAALDTFLSVIHTLLDTVPYTGWVSTAGLGADANTGIVHFSALAQRELGRRYAQRFLSVKGSLLVNGGFETNAVPAGGSVLVGSLSGWQASSGAIKVSRNLQGWQGADGSSWVELDAATAADTYSQTVTSTPGDLLTLRLWYAARPGTGAATNRFDVLWNGVVIDTLSPDGTGLTAPLWQSKGYAVTATGRDTFAFRESGLNDGVGTLLDAVTLASLGTGPHAALSNLALRKASTQSSEYFGGVAARAVDGNTSGNWAEGSVTHTAGFAQDWWQVDLGSAQWIDSVRLFNRADCCADRLSNFDVLISSADMTGKTLAQLRADPSVARQNVSKVAGRIELPFGTGGRYVRVQLAGTNNLSLAEVQVMGWPLPNGETGGRVACAIEGGNCVIPAGTTADVYYGVNGSYIMRSGLTGNVACGVAGFGVDPMPGAYKSCSYAPTGGFARTACGGPGALCSLPAGTVGDVYFGTGNRYSVRTGVTGVVCGNAFRDVNAGAAAQSCSHRVTGTAAPALAGALTPCAGEGSNCAIPSGVTADVYYGANGKYAMRSGLTGNVSCNTAAFGGDPVPYVVKGCGYAVTNTVAKTVCTGEGGLCTLPAGTSGDVYYGAAGKFAVRAGMTGMFCTAAQFGGDPSPGTTKACTYVTRP